MLLNFEINLYSNILISIHLPMIPLNTVTEATAETTQTNLEPLVDSTAMSSSQDIC